MSWITALLVVAAGILTMLPLLGRVKGPVFIPNNKPAPDLDSKVEEIIQAVGKGEGFGVPGAIPTVTHNPGDLGPGDTGTAWEVINASGSQVSVLPDDDTGWHYLRVKFRRILTGQSQVYSLDMTFTQVAQKYAGDWSNWVRNVTRELRVQPSTTLRQWLNN